MTGTAGQQRIDINYVKQYQIPVPSLEEQKMLLDEIHREQALIKPSKQIIDVFTAKIDTRMLRMMNIPIPTMQRMAWVNSFAG